MNELTQYGNNFRGISDINLFIVQELNGVVV